LILTECRACEAVVTAETLAQYTAVLDPESEATQRITFAQCPDCNSPLLIGEEFYGNERGREVWSEPYRLFPQRDEVVGPRVPRSVAKCYKEALTCFNARAYSAATTMCRKTLQAACVERHIHQASLSLALAEMMSQGIIEARMFEWAEALPQLANGGGPPDAVVSREDARDVLEFTDAFLAYLYTFRKGFHEFRTRHGDTTTEAPAVVELPAVASEPTALEMAAAAASRPANGEEPS